MKKATEASREAHHQTVPLKIETAAGEKSMQMGFTAQRLTPHGGLALMSSFLAKLGWRKALAKALPHRPTSPNAYAPVDIALGFMAGVLSGADKFSRVGQLCGDPALPEIMGIEAVASQPTLTRFFSRFSLQANTVGFGALHRFVLGQLPSHKGGYTLDLDSTCILHEDGHQEGVRVGYTPRGTKPAHHPAGGGPGGAEADVRLLAAQRGHRRTLQRRELSGGYARTPAGPSADRVGPRGLGLL